MKTEKCKKFVENFKSDTSVRGITLAAVFGATAVLMLLFGFWRVLFVFFMVALGYFLGTGIIKAEVNKVVPHQEKVIFTKEDMDKVNAVLKDNSAKVNEKPADESKQ
jgi:uncharacterized membrane protein